MYDVYPNVKRDIGLGLQNLSFNQVYNYFPFHLNVMLALINPYGLSFNKHLCLDAFELESKLLTKN